jgi:hypothetical protein
MSTLAAYDFFALHDKAPRNVKADRFETLPHNSPGLTTTADLQSLRPNWGR